MTCMCFVWTAKPKEYCLKDPSQSLTRRKERFLPRLEIYRVKKTGLSNLNRRYSSWPEFRPWILQIQTRMTTLLKWSGHVKSSREVTHKSKPWRFRSRATFQWSCLNQMLASTMSWRRPKRLRAQLKRLCCLWKTVFRLILGTSKFH